MPVEAGARGEESLTEDDVAKICHIDQDIELSNTQDLRSRMGCKKTFMFVAEFFVPG